MGVLDGKVALVTGGSRGIGRAVAERLGRDGAVVGVAYATDRAAADAVVAGIGAAGGRAFALRAEFGGHGDAARLWAAFDAATPVPGVDIIVNNAGTNSPADISALTEAEFDRVFAINVRAPFFVVREGLRRLRDGGRIVNISSGAARLAMPAAIAYGSTKGALDTFTVNLAKELGSRGITVNSVAPASSTPTSTPAGCAGTPRPWPAPRPCRRSAGSAHPTTSRASSPSWPPRTVAGSPAGSSTPPAGPDCEPAQPIPADDSARPHPLPGAPPNRGPDPAIPAAGPTMLYHRQGAGVRPRPFGYWLSPPVSAYPVPGRPGS